MNEQFEAGVQALRGGDRQTAADLLREVVAAEPTHEKAWLWLSGAVETAEERRHCLEQALALNPANETARRSLAKLPPKPVAKGDEPNTAVGWTARPSIVPYAAQSSFDDVWARAEQLDLCPYCAAELDPEHKKCPHCGRNLTLRFYRYENPSTNLHLYWVFVLGLGQLALLQLIFDVLMGEPLITLIQHGLLIPFSFIFTLFIIRRHFWAYIGSITMLLIAGTMLLAAPLIDQVMTEFLAGTTRNTPLFGLAEGTVSFINGAVRTLQLADIALGLFYGIFLVAPDFARDELRMTAAVATAPTAHDAFMAGERYAKKGMWASAVLNWRRAAGLEPTRLLYILHLARAYSELNFFERSLDVLQSASYIATTPEAQAKIQEELLRVETKQGKAPQSLVPSP